MLHPKVERVECRACALPMSPGVSSFRPSEALSALAAMAPGGLQAGQPTSSSTAGRSPTSAACASGISPIRDARRVARRSCSTQPATAGADYDGSAPGESLGVMLQPVSPLDQIHGILLTGGGPDGARRDCRRRCDSSRSARSATTGACPTCACPSSSARSSTTWRIGDGRIRVGPDEAYRACEAASAGAVAEGSVGAGAGATVGKMFVATGHAAG